MLDTTPTPPPPSNPSPLNPRLESFRIFQHNCRGSNVVFLSFCSIVRSRSPTLLVIQDPFLLNGSPPHAPGFVSLYDTTVLCPRVVFYLQVDFAAGVSFSLEFFNSPYLLALNVRVDHTDLRVIVRVGVHTSISDGVDFVGYPKYDTRTDIGNTYDNNKISRP